MLARDATLIAVVGVFSIGLCILLFKEFRLICFDTQFARGQGSPTTLLDLLLMGMVVAIVIIGLQAVGLILVIAILVIPSAAARFWTDSTARMIIIAAFIGSGCAWFGAAFSAIQPRLPSGAMIVLVLAVAFIVSLVLGSRHGLLHRVLSLRRQRAQIEHEHALRAAWECLETTPDENCTLDALAFRRGWNIGQAAAAVRRLVRGDFAQFRTTPAGLCVRLTSSGKRAAIDVVRRHRLWEHYLIRRADFDAGHVDRGADELEHLLPTEMLEELEADLEAQDKALPKSPHQIEGRDDTGGSA